MSIFATWLVFTDDHEIADGPAPLVYRGSHVSPAEDDPRGGRLEVAAIPNHCHPDVRFGDAPHDGAPPVDFLRLSLSSPSEDGPSEDGPSPGGPGAPPMGATVLLDRAQARRLCATLAEWLVREQR